MAKTKKNPAPPTFLAGPQRLNKILAAAGLGARRQVEELIEQGRVEVDGEVCSEFHLKVDPSTSKILVDGQTLKKQRAVYFALNKPAGVLCTNRDPHGRARVIDMVPDAARLFPVGRLDRSSIGLILLTNDGELAQRLAHPKYGVPKTYFVVVQGSLSAEQLLRLRKGIYLAEGVARVEGAKIRRVRKGSTELEITLTEGKNREIRRVLARLGHKVMILRRIAIGPLRLADLALGMHRPLNSSEVAALYDAAEEAKRARRRKRERSEGDVADGATASPKGKEFKNKEASRSAVGGPNAKPKAKAKRPRSEEFARANDDEASELDSFFFADPDAPSAPAPIADSPGTGEMVEVSPHWNHEEVPASRRKGGVIDYEDEFGDAMEEDGYSSIEDELFDSEEAEELMEEEDSPSEDGSAPSGRPRKKTGRAREPRYQGSRNQGNRGGEAGERRSGGDGARSSFKGKRAKGSPVSGKRSSGAGERSRYAEGKSGSEGDRPRSRPLKAGPPNRGTSSGPKRSSTGPSRKVGGPAKGATKGPPKGRGRVSGASGPAGNAASSKSRSHGPSGGKRSGGFKKGGPRGGGASGGASGGRRPKR